jgi:hypothetical protein
VKDLYIGRFGFDFKLQAVNYKEMQRLRQQATFTSKKGVEEFQPELFNALIVVAGVIEPSFNSPEILAKYGAAEDGVQALFLPGEIQKVSGEISALSGFGEDEEEAVKN